jgi:hypothetical protein
MFDGLTEIAIKLLEGFPHQLEDQKKRTLKTK